MRMRSWRNGKLCWLRLTPDTRNDSSTKRHRRPRDRQRFGSIRRDQRAKRPTATNRHFLRFRRPAGSSILTPCGLVASKSELEISRLTSAEASTRPQIPPSQNANLNPGAHENGLPEMLHLRKPDAPLTHPRPGYPLADHPSSGARFPAELASVSPGDEESPRCHVIQPLNTRAMPQKIPGGLGGLVPQASSKDAAQ
jgi:hypothetical protein